MPLAISGLTLYNCKLERSGHKTIDFSSASARDTYFSTTSTIATVTNTISNATYIREHGVITVGINADTLDANGVNYCRFINPQAGNFYRYCFIDEIEYVAPETTRLHIRIDAFVNNIGSIHFNDCFVEREHVSNDTLFSHTLAEPITIPYLVGTEITSDVYSGANYSLWKTNFIPVIFCKEYINNYPPTVESDFLGGMPLPCAAYAVLDMDNFNEIVNRINNGVSVGGEQLSNNVIGIAIAIKNKLQLNNIPPDAASPDVASISQVSVSNLEYSYTPNYTTIAGHTVRNNKCNCALFRHFTLTDRSNNEIDFNYEKCDNPNSIPINYTYAFGLNPVLSYYVNDYNGESRNLRRGISINDFPLMPYTSDAYNNWLAQNSNKLNLQAMTIGINAMSSAINGNIPGAVSGATMDMLNMNAMYKDMKASPDSFCGNIGGSMALANGELGFCLMDYHPTAETIRMIDNFFDCYGYNVSLCKTPQINSRAHYNYCKTQGSNIYGAIAEDQKEMIDRLFNEGITVWHMSSGASYGVYDNNNSIV